MHFTTQTSQRLNKLIRSLRQKKYRDQNDLFLAEGEKICRELLTSDYVPELLVIRDYPSAESLSIGEAFADRGVATYSAPKSQFDQLASSKSPQGIMAVVNKNDDEITPGKPFVALDCISDPGNVGTIIRTAEWFGICQIILGKDCADKYNPKTVRSTMGSIFKCAIVYQPDLAEFIKENFPGYDVFAATLGGKSKLKKIVRKRKKKYGVIFGNESNGISSETLKAANKTFRIEGFGNTESLNVAVAAGISLYHITEKKKSK